MEVPPPPYLDIITFQPAESRFSNQVVPTEVIISQPSVIQPHRILNELECHYICHGDRMIFDFEKIMCCPFQAHLSGLHGEVKHQTPIEIKEKNISPDQWYEWMSKLEKIQKNSPTISGCLLIFCFPGLCVQTILCAKLCPVSMDHCLSFLPCCYGDYYKKLREWMKNVNITLNQNGMHAKLVTYKPFNNAPKSKTFGDRVAGKNHDYEMSFLIIALTEGESIVLQNESWDHGINDECTSGIGRCL